MKVVVTGGTGFIGNFMVSALKKGGHDVTVLTRSPEKGSIAGVKYEKWTSGMAEIESWKDHINGQDAVIHLAGEPISEGKWTPAKKEAIVQSRKESTAAVVKAIELSESKPKVLVSSSAVGYYGPRGDEDITEKDGPGKDFMSNVCVTWEEEAAKASELGVRVAILRTGIVLGKGGGALEKLVQPFKRGIGGKLGSGQQWMPWIHMDDLIGLIMFLIENNQANGPFNGTAPDPVRNEEFTQVLGKILGKKPRISIPAFAVRMTAGKELADLALLSGQRAIPEKALKLGYKFKYTSLEKALESILKINHSDA